VVPASLSSTSRKRCGAQTARGIWTSYGLSGSNLPRFGTSVSNTVVELSAPERQRFLRPLPTDTVEHSGFLKPMRFVVPHFFGACQNHRSGITHCLAPESKGLNFRFADYPELLHLMDTSAFLVTYLVRLPTTGLLARKYLPVTLNPKGTQGSYLPGSHFNE
jgi:hypothetical protein